MKKVTLTLFAIFFLAGITSVSAQNAPVKEFFGFNKKYMDEMGVSAESQAKIEEIKKASDKEITAMRQDLSLSEDEKKQKLTTLSIKRQQTIYTVLTPDQINKVKEIQARIKARNEALGL